MRNKQKKMPLNRRQFIGGLGLTIGAAALPGVFEPAFAGTGDEPVLLTPEEATSMNDRISGHGSSNRIQQARIS